MATSAICTYNINLFSFFTREITSSKSFAEAGSIVNVKRFLKSFLFFKSMSEIKWGRATDSFITFSWNSKGRLNCLITPRTSTSGSPALPRTLMIFPAGNFPRSLLPQFEISNSTLSPAFAISLFNIKKSVWILDGPKLMKKLFLYEITFPTNFVRYLFKIFLIISCS